MIIELTPKVKAVCADHYTNQCGSCPIRSECVRPVGPSQDHINKWISEINDAADLVAI